MTSRDSGKTDAELLAEDPYYWRFLDPAFVAIHIRWRAAQSRWEIAWWKCPSGTKRLIHDGDDVPDDPAAREYVLARKAYRDDLKARLHRSPRNT